MRSLFCVAAALIALAAAGCPGTANQDACKAYVEHLNGLDCTADVDEGDACTTNYDIDGATNCQAFFTCLTENSRCDGDTFINGIDECGSCEVRK